MGRTILVSRQRRIDDRLRIAEDFAQVRLAAETLCIDLVDVLGAGRPRGKPAAGAADLDPTDWRIVAWCAVEHAFDLLAGQVSMVYLLRRKLRERGFLRRAGCGVDALVERFAELRDKIAVRLARVAAAACGHFGRQQRRDDAVFVGCPRRAVAATEGGAGTFF